LQVKAALQALPSIGDILVQPPVTAAAAATAVGDVRTLAVEFTPLGNPAHLGPQPLLIADASLLTGGSAQLAVTRATQGCCAVTVSLNGGLDWTPELFGIVYHYQDFPAVTAVTPSNGPATGGTLLTVSGGAFALGHAVSCVFVDAGVEVAAVRVTASSVTCVAPAVPAVTASAVAIRYATINICACRYLLDRSHLFDKQVILRYSEGIYRTAMSSCRHIYTVCLTFVMPVYFTSDPQC
jgi:IPT/TIG domain